MCKSSKFNSGMNSKKLLPELFHDTLKICSPSNSIASVLKVQNGQCNIKDQQFNLNTHPVYVLSVGKASALMYDSVQDKLGDFITDSLVITPEQKQASACKANSVIVGSHPTPDEKSYKAGKAAVTFLEEVSENALLLCLISGGTSSLMCVPAENISISDLNRTFHLLNNSGASIHEINTVRKHCSKIKGGQLLRHVCSGAAIVDLVISDVPDDDLSVIGSAPTIEDATTFQEAYHILLQYQLWKDLPDNVRTHIEKGLNGQVPETLKPGKKPHHRHHTYVISSAQKFAQNLGNFASQKGYEVWISEKAYNENVETVAEEMVNHTLSSLSPRIPQLFIFYGESYVKVTGEGKGGRNQDLALRGALKIDGNANVTWLSAGTDGVDGPTDAAGAIVDGTTITKARKLNMDPVDYLERNDSYHFHLKAGTLFQTGPTGNNLMDVTLIAVDEPTV